MTNSLTRRILGTVLFIGTLLFFLASLSWSAFSQTQPHVPRPYLVADINPGPDASNPDFLTAGSETLYAFASDPDQRGVWATDGSEEGTRFLAEIYPNYPNEYYVPAILYPTPVAEYGAPVAVGDDLFFVNKSDGEFDELWHSDGSPTGTMLINDTLSGTLGYPGYFMGSLTPFNQKELMFRGSDAEHGTELWISDGTLSQTHILTDLVPGLTGSLPYSLIHVDEHIYFRADDATLGDVLWRTDGTPEGTELVVDIPGDCAFLCNVTYVNGLFSLLVTINIWL
ncbi:MAG: hypothetical protein H6652_04280 [Ardenticatenaceae bacterium]|nr:hypothetical protein [Ardenticatenaceae bacterium]